MEFNEEIKLLASKIESIVPTIQTEEGTKMSLILPFFRILGYDVFNQSEFYPEYTADVGVKKGEKVDYAILDNGNPTVLIECKYCGEDLDKHGSQLFRYFSTTTAKFGILTNGIIYRFYTDLEEINKMDLIPFLEIDMLHLKENLLMELKKFCKNNFDSDKISSTAEELKYTTLLKNAISSEIDTPSENFVRMLLTDIYDGQKNQKVIEKFSPIVKKSFSSLISDIVNQKISSALTENTDVEISVNSSENTEQATEQDQEDSKVITTQEEIEAFYIIRGMLIGIIPLEHVVYRDTESYFGILYKDNNRKPICRINLDKKVKRLYIPNAEKKFLQYTLESLNDLYQFKNELIESAKRYIDSSLIKETD